SRSMVLSEEYSRRIGRPTEWPLARTTSPMRRYQAMKRWSTSPWLLALVCVLVARPCRAEPVPPLRLHPDNPHYLLFRGKPTVLITSGEHYGAVLNRAFDYLRYL